MNTQELLNKIKDLCILCVRAKEYIELESVLNLANQLDQQQKPVVKRFVAEWYEANKDEFEYNLWDWIYSKDEPEKIHSEFAFWVNDAENNPIQTLVNMHQFGYTVEKEKKYTVKLTKTQQYLYCIDNDFTFVTYARPDDNPRLYHTRKELEEAGFGEVFNSPLFEVEEVQDDSKI